jgi:CRISPR-associated endonuclease/helicase Cas3
VVLDPGPLVQRLDARGAVRSLHGLGSVYEDLRILEATRSRLLEHPELSIPAENRMLVERTSHPAALAATVERAGPAMQAHAISIEGGTLFRRQLAGQHCIDRTQAMGRYGFPSRDTSGRITTRLGEEDRLLELQRPFASPFGASIVRLKVPHWLARGIPADPVTEWTAVNPVSPVHGVRLSVSGGEGPPAVKLLYDRLGLRAEATGTGLEENVADD